MRSIPEFRPYRLWAHVPNGVSDQILLSTMRNPGSHFIHVKNLPVSIESYETIGDAGDKLRNASPGMVHHLDNVGDDAPLNKEERYDKHPPMIHWSIISYIIEVMHH